MIFLVFTWRQKKITLTILSFHIHQVKVILNKYLLACLQLGKRLCFEHWVFSQCVTSALFLGNMLRARKCQFALCFRVLSNKYVEGGANANVFKFNRRKKERAKVNSRCFHWFPAAMLERGSNMLIYTKHYNFPLRDVFNLRVPGGRWDERPWNEVEAVRDAKTYQKQFSWYHVPCKFRIFINDFAFLYVKANCIEICEEISFLSLFRKM